MLQIPDTKDERDGECAIELGIDIQRRMTAGPAAADVANKLIESLKWKTRRLTIVPTAADTEVHREIVIE